MPHGTLVASLADSMGRELTRRVPCMVIDDYPVADFCASDLISPMISEMLCVWCWDCGKLVGKIRMNIFNVYDGKCVEGFQRPGVPFDHEIRPRGQA